MADYTVNGSVSYSLKPYRSFDFLVPIDVLSGVPNYYFNIVQLDDAARDVKTLSIQLHSDDYLVQIGSYGSRSFWLWLPVDYDYKDFCYYLLLNKEFTKPTYLVTLDARPKITWSESANYIVIKFYVRHKLMQHVIIDKSKLRVLYLLPLYSPSVTKGE